ncbi:MAG: hypothetical protein ABIG67_06990 [Pseudomonadota bacterium]
MKKVFQIKGLYLLCLCLFLCLGPGLAPAADYYWVGGPSGSWSEPGNWNPSGPPGSGDNAYLTQSDSTDRTVLYDYTYTEGLRLGRMVVDSTGTGTITFNHTNYWTALWANEGWIGYDGTGRALQSVGEVHIDNLRLGLGPGSLGEYTLRNGRLYAFGESIGEEGTGRFIQEGGWHTVTNELHLGDQIGSQGEYTLKDGILSVGDEYFGYLGGTGRFTQERGSHTVSGRLLLGQGEYTLRDGDLSAGSVSISDGSSTGRFTQEGGDPYGYNRD